MGTVHIQVHIMMKLYPRSFDLFTEHDSSHGSSSTSLKYKVANKILILKQSSECSVSLMSQLGSFVEIIIK